MAAPDTSKSFEVSVLPDQFHSINVKILKHAEQVAV